MTTALVRRPAASLVAAASGEHLPAYVTREQARAIINAAGSHSHRLLLECLWQSGGRISEVLTHVGHQVKTGELLIKMTS